MKIVLKKKKKSTHWGGGGPFGTHLIASTFLQVCQNFSQIMQLNLCPKFLMFTSFFIPEIGGVDPPP